MSSHRQLRRLAAYVLLVWLFGLGSGIVNACLVAAEVPHPHTMAQPEGGAAEAAADEAHLPHGGLAKSPCERLCVDVPGAPQGDKQPGTPLTGLWLASAPLPSFHFKPAAALSAGFAHRAAGPRAIVPIPIALLRLTL